MEVSLVITDNLDDDLLGTPHDLDVEAPNAFNTWPATQQLSQLVWLVIWNMTFIFPYIGNNNPN